MPLALPGMAYFTLVCLPYDLTRVTSVSLHLFAAGRDHSVCSTMWQGVIRLGQVRAIRNNKYKSEREKGEERKGKGKEKRKEKGKEVHKSNE